MAKTALMNKALRPPQFKARGYRGYLRKFEMCRICFREPALKGEVPGVIKASW
ncbi:MAG: type Z 30S ribosomal protein S14 [Candidatus Rokubacteria bacterium]|nr:type Z 30S ribosomal protein S14 [Candidatus Rokubacteria bacterium]